MNTKGQSLIELIMMLPILIAFWASILWFSKALIISIELLHTARHGVFWLAYNHDGASSEQERQGAERECAAFLRQQSPGLDMKRVTITVQAGDTWKPMGPKSLLNVPKLLTLMRSLHRLLKDSAGLIFFQPASVRVDYKLPVPPLLRLIPGFPPTFPLRGYCVCYR